MSGFEYSTSYGQVTIVGYEGAGGDVVIPDFINDLPVTGIGQSAFYRCTGPTSITLPNSITTIGRYVFDNWVMLVRK